MVISEAPSLMALAAVSVGVSLLVTRLLAARRPAGTTSVSWLALAFVLAILVFTLGMVGIWWIGAFFVGQGSL